MTKAAQAQIEHKFGIPLFELLQTKYHTEKKGIKEISKELDMSDHSLWGWFENLGIDRRPRKEAVILQWKNNNTRRKIQGDKIKQDFKDGRRDPLHLRNVARTAEARKSNSDAKKGKNNAMYGKLGPSNPLWKGGKITEYGPGWHSIRKMARRRDGDKCVRCESTKQLEVHHIIPYRKTQDNSLENLVTLCHVCHEKVEHYGATW